MSPPSDPTLWKIPFNARSPDRLDLHKERGKTIIEEGRKVENIHV